MRNSLGTGLQPGMLGLVHTERPVVSWQENSAVITLDSRLHLPEVPSVIQGGNGFSYND
jgi:hypothetical protein